MGGIKRRKFVRTLVWNTKSNPRIFPEQNGRERQLPELNDKADLGVAFSGGGTRSASATIGQLRALKRIKLNNGASLLSRVKYISAVSGGSWATLPFTYLPRRILDRKTDRLVSLTDEVFLGPYLPPEKILSLKDLKSTHKYSLARAISHSILTGRYLMAALSGAGDETFATAISKIFLKPFGLDDNKKFFTWNAQTRSAIIASNSKRNHRHYLETGDFYTARVGRPFLIIGASLLYKRLILPLEITPLYIGVRQLFSGAGKGGRNIGGGYIESFAYDSMLHDNDARRPPVTVKFWEKISLKRSRKQYFYTLADVIGTSGAAPVLLAHSARVKRLARFVGFAAYRHWAIPKDRKGEATYQHGDGGFLDNLGIMPLLARGCRNIIVFINTKVEFKLGPSGLNKHYDSDMSKLFGLKKSKTVHYNKLASLKSKHKDRTHQVLPFLRLEALLKAFEQCQLDNRPLIHAEQYTIQANHLYNIQRYDRCNIVWCYNADVPAWGDLTGIRGLHGENKKGLFNNFPNYGTFMEQFPKIIDMNVRQINALAQFWTWCVTQNKQKLLNSLQIGDSRRAKRKKKKSAPRSAPKKKLKIRRLRLRIPRPKR